MEKRLRTKQRYTETDTGSERKTDEKAKKARKVKKISHVQIVRTGFHPLYIQDNHGRHQPFSLPWGLCEPGRRDAKETGSGLLATRIL